MNKNLLSHLLILFTTTTKGFLSHTLQQRIVKTTYSYTHSTVCKLIILFNRGHKTPKHPQKTSLHTDGNTIWLLDQFNIHLENAYCWFINRRVLSNCINKRIEVNFKIWPKIFLLWCENWHFGQDHLKVSLLSLQITHSFKDRLSEFSIFECFFSHWADAIRLAFFDGIEFFDIFGRNHAFVAKSRVEWFEYSEYIWVYGDFSFFFYFD